MLVFLHSNQMNFCLHLCVGKGKLVTVPFRRWHLYTLLLRCMQSIEKRARKSSGVWQYQILMTTAWKLTIVCDSGVLNYFEGLSIWKCVTTCTFWKGCQHTTTNLKLDMFLLYTHCTTMFTSTYSQLHSAVFLLSHNKLYWCQIGWDRHALPCQTWPWSMMCFTQSVNHRWTPMDLLCLQLSLLWFSKKYSKSEAYVFLCLGARRPILESLWTCSRSPYVLAWNFIVYTCYHIVQMIPIVTCYLCALVCVCKVCWSTIQNQCHRSGDCALLFVVVTLCNTLFELERIHMKPPLKMYVGR